LNIRCERCSTTYELDDSLLAPEGSPVQCTKCQHVFTAVPPRTAGRTLIGVPAAPAPLPIAPARTAPHEPPVASSRQGPAIYRPSHPATSSGGGAGGLRARRDTMGAFESRLKASARLRWLVPLVAAGILVVVAAAWALLSRGVDPSAARGHAEAMALVALDDIESLEKASRKLDELGRSDAGIESIDADRALAKLLLSTGILEDVSGPAARLAARIAERDRLAAALPAPGAPPDVALTSVRAEIEALRSQVEPRQAAARALSDQAYGELKQVSSERGREVAVARALAIHFASIGDREQALRFIRAAGASADRDPWVRLAEGWLDAREEDRESRERAVAKLTEVVAAHPEIVRARFLLARVQAALGKREVAAATLDGLLAVNPRHRRAVRLKGELVGAPSAAPPAAPDQAAPPVPRPLPRPLIAPAPAPVSAPAPAPASVPAPAPAVSAPRPVISPAQPGTPATPAAAPSVAPAPARPVVPVQPRPAAPAPAAAPTATPAPKVAPPGAPAAVPPAAPPLPEPRKAEPAPAPPAQVPGTGPSEG
jgi:predicted Zn finger-like uncharacterized protein